MKRLHPFHKKPKGAKNHSHFLLQFTHFWGGVTFVFLNLKLHFTSKDDSRSRGEVLSSGSPVAFDNFNPIIFQLKEKPSRDTKKLSFSLSPLTFAVS